MTEYYSDYNCGEPITAGRVQDEPWYSDHQSVAEVMCAGPEGTFGGGKEGEYYFERIPNGFERAKEACKRYFAEFPGPPNKLKPDDEQLERWIKSMWLSDESIAKIDKCREEEMRGGEQR